MERSYTRQISGALLLVGALAAIITLNTSDRPPSAALQLAIYAVAVALALMGIIVIFYAMPPQGAVLVVSRLGQPDRVLRGGGLVIPMLSTSAVVRLRPILLESHEPPNSGAVGQMPPKCFITQDGFPITTNALVEIAVADNPEGIRRAARTFGGKSDEEITKHFRRLLEACLYGAVGETDYLTLKKEPARLKESIQRGLLLTPCGYELLQAQITDITPLSVEGVALAGGDKIRAQEALATLDAASFGKIQDAEVAKEKSKEKLKQEQASNDSLDKQRVHDAKMRTVADDEAVKLRESVRDEAVEMQRRSKDRAIAQEQSRNDLQAQQLRALKLAETVEGDRLEQDSLRLSEIAKAERDKLRRILIAEGDQAEKNLQHAGEVERSRAALALAREKLEIRATELAQNSTHPESDLTFQLQKEVLRAAAEVAREQARAASAALTSARLTFMGDSTALNTLTKEYTSAAGLALRVREMLAVLEDVSVQSALSSTLGAVRAAFTGESPKSSGRSADEGRPPSGTDSEFEP